MPTIVPPPHADTRFPHTDITTGAHTDILRTPHTDTPAVHTDVVNVPHADMPAVHNDIPKGHVDKAGGHTDIVT
jgi:hypothetical protein